jgi:hypothetical protein
VAANGTHWGPTPPRCLFPVRALSTVCRAKVLASLPQAYHTEALRFAGQAAWCGSPAGFTHLLDQRFGPGVGGLRQAPVRRASPGAGVLGALYPPRRAGQASPPGGARRPRALHVSPSAPGQSGADPDAGGPGIYPALPAASHAPRLPAPAAYRLLGQPMPGTPPTPRSTPAGPAAPAAPTGATPRRGVDAAADRHRHSPMPALRPWSVGTPPTAPPDSAGAAPRGPTGGADCGLVMIQRLTCEIHRGDTTNRPLSPQRGACVSAGR